ncbi:MAG: hypothetical protein HOW73_20625 [Polyangiaceae bacterium]|nr:hypothetical protein [Polyangiaceae bacterium]
MAVDKLSGKFAIRTRDEDRVAFLNDYLSWSPDTDVSPGTDPYLMATLVADSNQPLYADASMLADATSIRGMTGKLLQREGEDLGRPQQGATGASGFVVIEAATGGGTILAGTELRDTVKGIRCRVLTTDVYLPGETCAIESLTTGPVGDLPAGTVLQWVSPPPGIGPKCTVFQNTDGSGLSGGHNAETDQEYVEALLDLYRYPPESGNEAAYIRAVHSIKGLAVLRAFSFPAVLGAGTMMIAFLMRPSTPGASRLPNGAHIAQVEAELKAQFPGDDGIFVATVQHDDCAPCFKVKFSPEQAGFVDSVPWPPHASPKVDVSNVTTISALEFTVENATTAPVAGQTIALFDATSGTFKRKRISAVADIGGNEYTLTISNEGSDPDFVPAAGAIVSPWADALNDIAAAILSDIDRHGPGEVFASFSDPGRRQRRSPEPKNAAWPSSITSRLEDALDDLVDEAQLAEPSSALATTVGTPGILVYLQRVADLGIFAI